MKFVVAAYGSRGDLEPCIAVAAELHRRGHDVAMALTVTSDMLAFVRSVGLSTVPYGRDWQELVGDKDFMEMLQNPINTLPKAIEYLAQVVAEKTTTLMSLTKDADLVVAGMTEQGVAANIAEYQHIPLAALHFFPPHIMELGSFDSRLRRPGDRAQRRALGLPEKSESALRPLEIQAYDELCAPGLAAEWTECADRRPFVGTLTLQLPTDADDEVLPWTAAGSPPIYVGFGSTALAAPADMVAVIGAACARIGRRALICLPANDAAGISYPDHVKVVHEVNYATVLPACGAVVHHGGAGTTAAGLRAGTPNLILWNGLDQPLWAAAVERLEVGFGRSFAQTTLDSLTADLRAILKPQYATRARAVATQMSKPAESLAAAADLIEDAARQGLQD